MYVCVCAFGSCVTFWWQWCPAAVHSSTASWLSTNIAPLELTSVPLAKLLTDLLVHLHPKADHLTPLPQLCAALKRFYGHNVTLPVPAGVRQRPELLASRWMFVSKDTAAAVAVQTMAAFDSVLAAVELCLSGVKDVFVRECLIGLR